MIEIILVIICYVIGSYVMETVMHLLEEQALEEILNSSWEEMDKEKHINNIENQLIELKNEYNEKYGIKSSELEYEQRHRELVAIFEKYLKSINQQDSDSSE